MHEQAVTPSWTRALLPWLLAAVLPIFAILPAVTTPVENYAIDTAAFHIYRTVVFSEARDDGGGMLPRWTQPTNGGLGGPLFAYTPTLMYFLMDGFHALGLDTIYTWRAVIALMLVIASVGMFGLARALFHRNDAAYLSAAAFVYAPLLLRDFIERGSPQSTGIALFPWVLWAVLRLIQRPSGLAVAAAAVAWGLLLFAHNLSALLLAPVIAWLVPTMMPALNGAGRRLAVVILALAAGSLLVAFYVFPVFAELDSIQIDNPRHTPYAYPPANPTSFSDLFALPPVFDAGLGNNTMGAGVGLFHIFISGFVLLIFAISLPLFWASSSDRTLRQFNRLGVFLVGVNILGALAIWLQTDSATPVWRAFTFLDVLQFRFRLLSLFVLAAALNFGWFITFLARLSRSDLPDQIRRLSRETTNITIPILGATIAVSLFALYPDLMHRHNTLPENLTSDEVKARAVQSNTASLAAFNEYVPIWRHMPFTADEMQRAADMPIANLPAGARITQDSRRTTRWQIGIETPEAFTAAFYLLYYPGWEARMDGTKASIRPADEHEILPNTGYLLLDIPAGSHAVTLDYTGTPAQRLGDWTSIITALLLVGIVIRDRWLARRAGGSKPPANSEQLEGSRAYLVAISLLVLVAGNKTVWIDQSRLLLPESSCGAVHDVDQFTPVDFGRYRLCGYEVEDATLRSGALLELTLYWQVNEAVDRPATSFAHVIGDLPNAYGAPVWGEADHHTPGNHPTSEWTPGKLYRDEFHIPIPEASLPGVYQIEIGWTQWDDGARIPPAVPAQVSNVALTEWESLFLTTITLR